ncbi:GNAT family N-acetyltransferase [Flavobacteriales bacterium]|nr:GNAT family N-acetyltransferase [Flavobacteriales bacterium]
MEYRLAGTSPREIEEYQDLLTDVFNIQWSKEYLSWLYKDNPDGNVVGYNAYHDANIVAHYATIPIIADVDGKYERGLLSLNTATRPEYSGRGLFTTLANKTYKFAKKQGYTFVVGVANTNSTRGFTSKLGFDLVAPLKVKLGIGFTREIREKEGVRFRTYMSQRKQDWRFDQPGNKYFSNKGQSYSPTEYRLINAILSHSKTSKEIPSKLPSILNLWIGLNPKICWKGTYYFDLPERLKPSPLNLIFKDLSGLNRKLDKNEVLFELVDFDAY